MAFLCYQLYQKKTPRQVFSREYCEILKITVMQIGKPRIINPEKFRMHFQMYPEKFSFQLFIIL